jgi:hypothetical protein
MTDAISPFRFLVITLAGWLNRQQQAVIDYLNEENRVATSSSKDGGFWSPTNNGCD